MAGEWRRGRRANVYLFSLLLACSGHAVCLLFTQTTTNCTIVCIALARLKEKSILNKGGGSRHDECKKQPPHLKHVLHAVL